MEDHSQGMSVQQQFAIRRNRQLMTAVPIVLLVLAMSTEDKAAQTVLGLPIAIIGPIGAVLAVALLVFSFMNWRCPACRRYLGRRINPKFCGSCGVQLRGGAARYVTAESEINPANAPIQPSRGGAAKWV